jgi:heat shock protein HslJ
MAIGEQLGVTMMLCADDLNAQEQAYLIALQQATSYRITDSQLELMDANGRTTLKFAERGPSLEGRPLKLEAYVDSDGQEVPVIPGTEVTIEFEDGRLGGSAGCNNYFGAYEVDGNQVAISGPLGSTRMMCGAPEGVMEQEQAYLAALQQAASFEATDEQLLISDSSGQVILRYKVLEPTSLTGTTWLVTGYNNGRGGFSSLLRDTDVTAVFVDDGSLVGSAGCNQYTTSYQIDGDSITIGPVGLTRKMCNDPEGIMEQEQAYLAALESAATFSIKGDRLELRDTEGTRMVAYVAGASSE